MARTRVYINPFDASGEYAGFQDVTKYISKMGDVGIDIDSNDYQLGVYRNSNFSFDAVNRDGRFSDIDILQSIFRYKRGDSIVRVTWTKSNDGPYAGFFDCGEECIAEEVTVFEGLLSDDVGAQDAKNEKIKFTVVGFEDLFDRSAVGVIGEEPFDSLSIGTTVKNAMYTILNQSGITDLLTLSLSNISLAVNTTLDVIDDFSGQTVSDVLDELLRISNSILYIKDRTIYIKDRLINGSDNFTFYGQASNTGVENILNIANDKTGAARIYNYFTWADSVALSKSNASITKYGVRTNEITSTAVTNVTHQTDVLDSFLAEFKDKEREFEVSTILTYDTLALNVKDGVNVDYPIVYVATGFDLPICGLAILGTARLPRGIWFFKVSPDEAYKIISFKHSFEKLVSTFKLRKVG